jgi:hypothetical protein
VNGVLAGEAAAVFVDDAHGAVAAPETGVDDCVVRGVVVGAVVAGGGRSGGEDEHHRGHDARRAAQAPAVRFRDGR